MRIILMDWNSIGNQDITECFQQLGHTVIPCPFNTKIGRENSEWEESFTKTLRVISPDLVFSFNYFPIISKVCELEKAAYYSWVYDSPLHSLFSRTIYNHCNHIFLFDRELCSQLKGMNIETVHYLPLAVNTLRLQKMKTHSVDAKYCSDISFVGSLYTEEKHRLFERLKNAPEYINGYLDALVEAQKNVYGSNIIKDAISDEILQKMMETYSVEPHKDGMETSLDIYSDYFLLREVTARERHELLMDLGTCYGNDCSIKLYTHDITAELPGIQVFSEVDYYNQMPYVFMNSRINLNISLRSIISGIPLRALDIMGCGGFLLTNYQADFLEYFTPDTDFVYYDSKKDLLEKTSYYLKHEDERQQIASNGYTKICEYFTYQSMVAKMLLL